MARSRKKEWPELQSDSGEFSESELDAARQLVQLSVSGSNSSGVGYDGGEDDVGTNHEASSALRVVVAAADEDHGGELWQPLKQRTKKFRSIEQVYASTLRLDPLDKKKRKCSKSKTIQTLLT